MLVEALKAADCLKKDGIDVEVVDIRSLKPLDEETIIQSVINTGHLIVVDGAWRFLSISAEIISIVVENAFKHGDIKDGFLQLEIEIEARNNLLDFKIRNTILQTDDNNELQGIGLENIRKRLDLHYKEKYKLEIKTDEHWFSVKLRILNLNAISNV